MCNHIELLHATTHETAHLAQQVIDRLRLETSRHQGDSTKGTEAVAPLGNLQVGIMAGSRHIPLVGNILMIGLAQVVEHLFPVELAVKLVDLGQFLLEFIEKTLRETAHDNEFPQLASFFGLTKLENHIDRFLLRISDKATGVYHGNLAVNPFWVVGYRVATSLELTYQVL